MHAQSPTVTLTPSQHNGYNITCFGKTDGSIIANVTGGMPPYTYEWTNDQTTQNINNLAAGYYSVRVTDAAMQVVIADITLIEPEMLELQSVVFTYPNGKNISLYNGYDGSITVTTSGGVAAYSFLWSDGNTNKNRTTLGASSYMVTVTDGNGCTLNSDRFVLSQPDRSDWTMTGNANTNPTTQFIGTTDNKDLIFKTNNTERLQITSDGKLKIKNLERNNPGLDLLFVNANGEVEVAPKNCNQALNMPWFLGGNYFGANSTSTERQIGTCTNHEFTFITNALERARFTSNGNLGIGTSLPQSKVAVNGNLSIGDSYAGINAPANGLIVEGKVGIGTSTVNALAMLQLKGNTPNFYITDNGAASTSINLQNNDGYWHISGPRSNETGKPLSIFWNDNTNYTRIFSILNDGTVAIGVDPSAITLQNGTTPYKLIVNGKLGANEIWTSLGAPWPDYVFEPTHKYLSIDELQNYVSNQKHLPGMPTANDIATNGKLNVTQTIIQQQEKLEEAYLYIFELKKELDALKLLLKK
nr:SprB repeat-containing protein [Bacteroidota bacterium]